eukprot:11103496-Heterocapsa_arctica.AAC.1
MGWSWSLFFAQAAMSAAVMRALPRSPLPADREGYMGGLIEDARPVPLVGPRHAVCAVYVDNATIIGASLEETTEAVRLVRAALDAQGLI